MVNVNYNNLIINFLHRSTHVLDTQFVPLDFRILVNSGSWEIDYSFKEFKLKFFPIIKFIHLKYLKSRFFLRE